MSDEIAAQCRDAAARLRSRGAALAKGYGVNPLEGLAKGFDRLALVEPRLAKLEEADSAARGRRIRVSR